jgi:hypothetical protein
METFLQDLRFAARGLRRTPMFTAAAIFALAIWGGCGDGGFQRGGPDSVP